MSVLKFLHLFFFLVLIGCNAVDSSTLGSLAGVANNTSDGTNSSPRHFLRIMRQTNLVGVGNTTVSIGSSLAVRAVLIDESGNYVRDIAATWFLSGTLKETDLTITGGNPSINAVFSPTIVSTGTINATVDDLSIIRQYNVTPNTTSTGTISASTAIVPDQIVIMDGNSQTGVAGQNLTTDLKVKVLNPGNLPVSNVDVTFSVLSGGGTIVSAQPVQTDINGEATATVQLGTLAGTNNNSFSATIFSGTTTQVIFSASASAGPASKLAFYQQPAGATVNSTFYTQPIVEIQDVNGNKVSSATNAVTISLGTGTGALSGTLTNNPSSGRVTYTNIRYNTQENNITLVASAAGLTSATSNAFNVGQVDVNAQCLVHANFVTTEGGCLDLTSGLVWSASSATTMSWHQAVWDSSYTSVDPETWEANLGITRDLDGVHPDTQDSNVAAYCHSLTESGYSDWRVPTVTEAVAVFTNGGNTGLQNTATSIWTGSRTGGGCTATSYNKCTYNIGTGAAAVSTAATTLRSARCVRKPRAVEMVFSTQPAAPSKGFGVNVPFETQPVITFKDSLNTTDVLANYNVTLTAVDGTGNLVGTTTVTAVNGVATFSGIAHGKAETIRLKASAAGFNDIYSNNITINQTYPWALCQGTANAADYINALGGCKMKSTGYIFSSASTTVKTWHETIWDDVVLGLETADDDDNGRTDDYSTIHPAVSSKDTSATNYCKDLTESGQTDWFPPYYTPMVTLTSLAPTTSVNFHSTAVWTSATVAATQTNAYFYNAANAMSNGLKTGTTVRALCVRQDAPAQLTFSTQPDGGANGYGAGIVFATQPVVQIQDADGAILYGMNVPVTIRAYYVDGVTPAAGNLWVDNVNNGTSVTVTSVNGTATFSGLNYDIANETIILKATVDPISWRGSTVTPSAAVSNNIVIPLHYSLSQCAAPNANWATANGGCRDLQAGGLVWTHVSQSTRSWYKNIWDSTAHPDADEPDSNDGARTDDYDLLLGPLAGVDNDPEGYCHTLRYNGYNDWRVPTRAEMDTGLRGVNRAGIDQVYTGATVYIWSSATDQSTPANSLLFRISTKTWHTSSSAKTSNQGSICVRSP